VADGRPAVYTFSGDVIRHLPGGTVSRSLNKVTLIGNLGADPEVRSATGGNRVANFSLATSRQWTGANGEKQEKTEWHRCVAWNTKTYMLADIVEKYLKKGDKVFVEGSIEYRQWQDKENQTRYATEIKVREMIMLSGRQGGGGDDAEAGAPRSRPKAAATGAGGAAPGGDFEDFKGSLEETDDDLPF
jgi:single-strand DNA-binding protein